MCRVVLWGFAIAYALAVGLLLIGTFGLFGQEKDPLSGVFVLALGLPWTMLAGRAPELLRPWLAVLAPALNLALLAWLCRALKRPAGA